MNTLSKLTLLACAFISVTACNEKVSPELQGASSSTTSGSSGGGSTVVPDEYYFRVVNKADTLLNFKLHKTGAGNANKNCEITSSIAFSSDLYRADQSTYDITCFYEAEELALNFNGFSFAVEASENSCPFVGYSPFSYYNFQPGSSSQTIDKLTCEGTATAGEAFAQLGGAVNVTQACDTYMSKAAGITDDVIVTDEQVFCNFDYSTIPGMPDNAPNCDEGILKFNDYTVTGIDNDGDGTSDTFTTSQSVRTVKCNGKAVNCIEGPIKYVSTKFTNILDTIKSTSNTPFSKTYVLPSLLTKYYTNRQYVNYRRDLASTEIEFGNSDRDLNDMDSSTTGILAGSYLAAFGDPLYKSAYDPNLMANYALNRRMDGSDLVDSATQALYTGSYMRNLASGSNFSYGVAYAAEPFVGLSSSTRTSPFYAFYCFDNAFDLKARIRMVVRDWDRALPLSATSTSFERISDVDLLPPLAYQDVPYTEEISGDPDSWNDFNDLNDWDDMIDMERDDSGVPYDPSITIWRPMPEDAFLDGFLNPYLFPMEIPEG